MAVETIFFEVAPDLPPERLRQVLDQLAGLSGVEKVVPLVPGARNPTVACTFYAYAAQGTNLPQLVERVRALSGVASASLELKRRLIE